MRSGSDATTLDLVCPRRAFRILYSLPRSDPCSLIQKRSRPLASFTARRRARASRKRNSTPATTTAAATNVTGRRSFTS
jgi:hypothetical protein